MEQGCVGFSNLSNIFSKELCTEKGKGKWEGRQEQRGFQLQFIVLELGTVCIYKSLVKVLVVYSLTGANSNQLNGIYIEYTCKD